MYGNEMYVNYIFSIIIFLFVEKRNVRGDDRLYVTVKNSGYNFIKGLYENKIGFNDEVSVSIDGMQGTVLLAEDCVAPGG
jgi:5'-3' exoribonuclease 2